MLAEENANSAKYEFDGFSIDAAGRRVLHAGEQLQLTPKIFDTLLYLVENAGRLIEKDELMQAIWPDTIVEENNLNKNISVLRRVLNERQGENRYIATIPGRGYKFVAKVTRTTEENDPDSEVHENEERLETDVAASETVTHEPEISEPAVTRPHFPRNYLAILAAIVLALALALGYYFWPRSAPHLNTIAVLPFKPISTTERDEALEMGMADTLISRLGGGPDVIVRPLASVRRYSGLDQDPIAAARELGVETVLEGNLQRVGDDIRVNARLIRASDGSALWSGTYDERFTNIFALQDRISSEIAAALKARLGGSIDDKATTANVEAYRMYLQGRYHALKSTSPEIRQGIDFYKKALALDPNYALANAGLAEALVALPITSDIPPAEAFPEAKAAALRALDLDPDLAEAHLVLGVIDFWYEWHFPEAEQQLQKAIAIQPNNADAHRFYAVLLTITGRGPESIAELEKAKELSPLSLIVNALESQAYLYDGNIDKAIEQANKTLEIEPNFWIAHLMLARAFIQQGRFDEAALEAEKAAKFSAGNSEAVSLEIYALAKGGRRGEALSKLDDLKKRASASYVPSYNLAMISLGLGQTDEALDHLDTAIKDRDARAILLKVEPKWNAIRDLPRFDALFHQVYPER